MFHLVTASVQLYCDSKASMSIYLSELKHSGLSLVAGVYPWPLAMKLDSIAVKPMNMVYTLMWMTAIRYKARATSGLSTHS